METLNVNKAKRYVLGGKFQLARELLVIDESKDLVMDAYPRTMGNAATKHPYVKQSEQSPKLMLKTPVAKSLDDAYRNLKAITEVLQFELQDKTIWPFSLYSELSGVGNSSVTVSFDFTEEFYRALFEDNPHFSDIEYLKQIFYQQFNQKLNHYNWLNIYVNGATPFKEGSLYGRSLAHTVDSATNQIDDDLLPIKIKLDINPFVGEGVSKDQLESIYLLILTLIWDFDGVDGLNEDASDVVASENPQDITTYRSKAKQILEKSKRTIYALKIGNKLINTLNLIDRQFAQPTLTISGRLTNNGQTFDTFIDQGVTRAENYRLDVLNKRYKLFGYEHMEISTQMVIFDAIVAGVEFEIIDEKDHLLRLTVGEHQEYVQQATRTTKVPYISSLILENKVATKAILKENGFNVPDGDVFFNKVDAKLAYINFADKAVVVKPKSTNGGKGITVFVEPPEQKYYDEAVETAFDLDDTILVEAFHSGKEYRFHIQGGTTRDVLYREPANIVGDGVHTIKELIDKKNESPYRGKRDESPMVTIELGKIELNRLREQGLSGKTIPDAGKKIYLRENSNVSTGGESQSYLGRIHESYVKVAEGASKALNASINGLDLIIPDINKPSTPEDPGYVIIEGNANPGLYGHMYLADGRGVRLSMHLLTTLFPELEIDPNSGNY